MVRNLALVKVVEPWLVVNHTQWASSQMGIPSKPQ